MGWVDKMKKLVVLFLLLLVALTVSAGGCDGYQVGQPCEHEGDTVGEKGVVLKCHNGVWQK